MAKEPVTTINLPELGTREDCGRIGIAQLEMRTCKFDSGQLVSSAHVHYRYPDGGIIFEMFGDFSKTYIRSRERGTQKNLDHQHAIAFCDNNVEAMKRDVLDFYAAKAAKRQREVA